MSLTISSPAFGNMAEMPVRHTCEGDDISPALVWSGVPPGAASLALIVDDPDAPDPAAPKRTWVHWVLYDLPPDCDGLPEAVLSRSLPAGTKEGMNDWNRTGWGGPCPPIGRHRYFHKLFALDIELGDLGSAVKSTVMRAMDGHVLASAELVGTYEKRGA